MKYTEAQLYGQGIVFPPKVGANGSLLFSAGPQNIRESIRIILTTEPGERIMLRSFGAGLKRFLYEPNIEMTRTRIAERIINALKKWEPRIVIKEVTVIPDQNDPRSAIVTIYYDLVVNRQSDSISLRINLGQ